MFNIETEQSLLLKDFSDPKEFITKYSQIYNNQSLTPYKVFPHMIPYLSKFNILFLDHLFRFIQENSENIDVLDKEMTEIDTLIRSIKEMEFYDSNFYEVCGLIFIKSLIFLIDQCEYKILTEKDTCLINKYVIALYKFCPLNIDLNKLFSFWIENATNNESLIETLRKIKEIINTFKYPTFITSFKNDQRLLSRLNSSERYLGEKRESSYDFNYVIDLTLNFISNKANLMNREEGYNYLIQFALELENNDLSNENTHKKIRNIANTLFERE